MSRLRGKERNRREKMKRVGFFFVILLLLCSCVPAVRTGTVGVRLTHRTDRLLLFDLKPQVTAIKQSGNDLMITVLHTFGCGPYQPVSPHYKLIGSAIILAWDWHLEPIDALAARLCTRELEFTISDLPKHDYDVRIDLSKRRIYGLYSWQDETGDWFFSLLPGDESWRTEDEIKKKEFRIHGVERLKKTLSRLTETDTVAWNSVVGEKGLRYPDEKTITQITNWTARTQTHLIIYYKH